jgi:hypothetical protein
VHREFGRPPEAATPQSHKALPFADKRAILTAHRYDGPDGACAEPGSPEENVLRKDRSIQSHTWSFLDGHFERETGRSLGDGRAGGTHLMMRLERRATGEDVTRGTIEVGERLVESGAVRIAKPRSDT